MRQSRLSGLPPIVRVLDRPLDRIVRPREPRAPSTWEAARAYGGTALVLAAVTAVLLPFAGPLGLLNVGLIYLIVVVAAATLGGLGPGLVASVLAFLLLDFFLVPPYLTLIIADLHNILALAVFLGLAVLISNLIARARAEAAQAQRRATDLGRLYALTQAALGATGPDAVLPALIAKVVELFDAAAGWILLPAAAGRDVAVAARAPAGAPLPDREQAEAASRAYTRGELVDVRPHGGGAVELGSLFAPLRVGGRVVGVLGVAAGAQASLFSPAEQTVLVTLANQVAMALERLRLHEEAERAAVLARTDALKSALLHAVSHDLRTPLASIKAAVSSLLDPAVRWDAPARQAFLEAVDKECDRLTLLVSNLLDMSRIESGNVPLERDPYPIREVISTVRRRLAPRLAGHPLEIDAPAGLPPVPLDFVKIDQVLTNLLENAIAYTPPGTPIRIHAHCTSDQLVVSVADQGPGVAPLHLPHLFDKFYRVAGTGHVQGSGLGLSIAKGMIEAHGGTMVAANGPGRGLIVTFTLPLAPPERLVAPAPLFGAGPGPGDELTGPDPRGGRGMAGERVLLIDDEPMVARAVRIGLEGYGFVVDTAATGEDGYAQALGRPAPQVVLLDLGLPDQDGQEVCAHIRAQSAVPIIILTARGAEHEKIAALDAGADDYVTKPFGMGELLARIRVSLRHAAAAALAPPSTPLRAGDLLIDAAGHEVTVRDSPVRLTPTEFKLLVLLASNPDRVMTHRLLLREVWGSGYTADVQLLRVFIGQLRTKIERDPTEPEYILTEPGVGYRFRGGEDATGR